MKFRDRDGKPRDRDETRDPGSRDRDETETLLKIFETRRDQGCVSRPSRDRDVETESATLVSIELVINKLVLTVETRT